MAKARGFTALLINVTAKQATNKRSASNMGDFVPPFCSLSVGKMILYRRKLEVKPLTFLTADSQRERLERLTQRLISAFPGCTIYQHTELCRVPHDIMNHHVDAVFLAAEMEKQTVWILCTCCEDKNRIFRCLLWLKPKIFVKKRQRRAQTIALFSLSPSSSCRTRCSQRKEGECIMTIERTANGTVVTQPLAGSGLRHGEYCHCDCFGRRRSA
jgi:hypothetical protein